MLSEGGSYDHEHLRNDEQVLFCGSSEKIASIAPTNPKAFTPISLSHSNFVKPELPSPIHDNCKATLNVSYMISGGCGAYSNYYTLIFVVGTESREFYLIRHGPLVYKLTFKELLSDDDSDLNNMSSHVRNSSTTTEEIFEDLSLYKGSKEMKQVVCCNSTHVLFEMWDGALFLFSVAKQRLRRFHTCMNSGLAKFINCGHLSQTMIVCKRNLQDYVILVNTEYDQEIYIKLQMQGSRQIKFASGYCREAHVFVMQDNKFYCYIWKTPNKGSTMADGFGKEFFKMLYFETPFEKTIPVVQLACGYAHVVLLLQNGRVFTRGLNNFQQGGTSVGKLDKEFFEVQLDCPVRSISCGSICTGLETEREFIFLGQIGHEFEKLEDASYQRFSSVVDNGNVHVVPKSENEQAIVMGPWHAVIYRKRIGYSKDLRSFFEKLKERIANNSQSNLYDMVIWH
ncbi:hypothetical protein C9374_006449 [Naegleria lovaniensis]|uniref:Uncharacterized protein n=1 Tax=Naegleria lovaniensis TaxID=51637 RepID=A0AA88GJT9_NAELO|nr:uncharacterized protein C9374_006449 [Naegleria lovaniensis]KAG2381460.1 hypothetical protein C9374_006449 [Naegleria lovaniensis]